MKAQIRLPLPPSYPLQSFYTFPILAHSNVSTIISSSGEKFAALNKKACHDIQALLLDGKTLRFQAYITATEWTRAQQSWNRESTGTLTIDINIYGQFEHAFTVGRTLALNRTYLQQPLHGLDGIRYYNPQYLHTGDFLGEAVFETPRYHMEAPVTSKQQNDESVESKGEQQERDDTREIHSILDSLSHRKILGRAYTTDRRMKTALLQ